MDTTTRSTKVLRMKDVSQKIGYAQSTIYELVALGKFPAPFKLIHGGRAAGWLESTVDAYLEERASESHK